MRHRRKDQRNVAAEPVLQTEQETSQPNEMSVEYWATGLEPIYFEGAFERARPKI